MPLLDHLANKQNPMPIFLPFIALTFILGELRYLIILLFEGGKVNIPKKLFVRAKHLNVPKVCHLKVFPLDLVQRTFKPC